MEIINKMLGIKPNKKPEEMTQYEKLQYWLNTIGYDCNPQKIASYIGCTLEELEEMMIKYYNGEEK